MVSAGAGRRPAALAGASTRRPAGWPDRLVRRRDPARGRGAPSRPGRPPTRSGTSPARWTPRTSAHRTRRRPSSRRESERFLFYRGLGQAPLPVRFTSSSGGTLAVGRDEAHGSGHVFILRVEGGRGAYAYRPALSPGQTLTDVIPSMDGVAAARRVRRHGRRRPPPPPGRERPLRSRRPGRWSTPGGPATSGPRASAPCS